MKIDCNGTIRDMTPEEIADFERIEKQMQTSESTLDERVNMLEATTDDMILLMAELIGG